MRKRQLFKKKILALALSISMVSASMNTYVALAAEAENLEVAEDNDYQTDGTETMPAVSNEESDPAGDVDVETGVGSANGSAVSDDIDSTSQTDKAEDEEADVAGDSDDAGEDDSAGDSDITTKEDETDPSESEIFDEIDADAVDEEDAEVPEADEPNMAVNANGFTVDDAGKLTAYSGDGGDITIPDGVITIGSGALGKWKSRYGRLMR